jgi:hypothetical protein
MKQKLVECLKVRFLSRIRSLPLEEPLITKIKMIFARRNKSPLNKKIKGLIVFVVIAVMLISTFAFLPRESQGTLNTPKSSDNPTATISSQGTINHNSTSTPSPLSQVARFVNQIADSAKQIVAPDPTPHPPGVVTSAQTINSTVWLQVAANAWAFYQPTVGVDVNTGLPYSAGTDYKVFTDWDLGAYIQAIIDAQKIGLIDTNGTWGSYDRLDKVLTFLETRPLNNATGYPFWFYDAVTGGNDSSIDSEQTHADGADTGRLFVALNSLKNYNSANFAARVDNYVYNKLGNRSDYSVLVPNIKIDASSNNLYAYYIDSGFASFWPQQIGSIPSTILNNVLNSPNIMVNGVSLPNAAIINEPLLSAVFELNNSDSSRLKSLMSRVYLAHEAYYNETGIFLAPSEGGNPSGAWLYEWVVAPNGQPWQVSLFSDQTVFYNFQDFSPFAYSKVAFSFLSLYNTTFARNEVVWLEAALPVPANGYCDGVDANGNIAHPVNIGQTLILDAARYALNK